MPGVSELILIRHGQSASNVALPAADSQGLMESGLSGRDTDVELTELASSRPPRSDVGSPNCPRISAPRW